MRANNFISNDLEIKTASIDDIAVIQSVAHATWPVAYRSILSDDQLVYMLDKFYSIQSLTSQLQTGHNYHLALKQNNIVGFASFTHEHEVTYKLQKLYVLPTLQKTGAGKLLLNHVENTVKNLNGEILLLNVNRNNAAKSFYEKCGYKIIKEEDIDIGNGYFMNDYVMEKKLI